MPAPVAIAVAPNGGRRTKADHPALPMTPEEIARAAAESLEAGAAMVHVHVRDAAGRHVLDPEIYRTTIAAIRAEVGDRLVIQTTSEALGMYQRAQQMAVAKAVRPEAVSLALRELAPDAASEGEFSQFLDWLKRERVVPQIILYTPAEAAQLADLHRRGLVPFERIPVLYVLGRYAVDQTSQPTDLLLFLAPGAPRFDHWMVCAFGRRETACVTAAALLGGQVRVGFENNLWLPDGSEAKSNASLVEAAARALATLGYKLSNADQLRTAWNL